VELFLKYKILILRTVGVLMLIVGFAVQFWTMPKEGLTKVELAAANVARMESKMQGSGSGTKKATSSNKYLKELKNKQAKQVRYLTIIAMVLGVGFLGYSFIKKKEDTI
jgi:hypothetical protein